MALQLRDECERDPGVAAGWLEQLAPRLDLARALRRLDHRFGDAVLDRAGRVLAFELRVEPNLADRWQLDEWRVPDEFEDVPCRLQIHRAQRRSNFDPLKVRSTFSGYHRPWPAEESPWSRGELRSQARRACARPRPRPRRSRTVRAPRLPLTGGEEMGTAPSGRRAARGRSRRQQRSRARLRFARAGSGGYARG